MDSHIIIEHSYCNCLVYILEKKITTAKKNVYFKYCN